MKHQTKRHAGPANYINNMTFLVGCFGFMQVLFDTRAVSQDSPDNIIFK
jgi:hypothetical protein